MQRVWHERASRWAQAVGRLIDRGVPVLSQSVLMRGVNDRTETLAALFRALGVVVVFAFVFIIS